MLAAISKRNPASRYFAALLPLCKNLIMDGKLQEILRSTILNYKWAGPLTKLYPLANGRTGQRAHHTSRHTPKYRFCANGDSTRRRVRDKKLRKEIKDSDIET